jgi:hypothetical protein
MTTITRVYRADWAPHIEQAARAIATAAAFVYVCGYVSGRWLHRLNDRLSALLVRKPEPDPYMASVTLLAQWNEPEPPAPVRYECAAVPARCGIMAPTPMARAISHVKGGMSQRKAATLCGVSRSSLQRALKG